jgi:uncharacterized repeat protein (TIGR01451 family)/MYXO-CTERM domain-containing protein
MRNCVKLPIMGLLFGAGGCSGDMLPIDEHEPTATPAVASTHAAAQSDVMTPAQLAHLKAKGPQTAQARQYEQMSMMGALASGVAPLSLHESTLGLLPMPDSAGSPPTQDVPSAIIGSADTIVHVTSLVGYQTETSIAANADGSILVVGYNDVSGFAYVPVSLMGITRSIDGGATWSIVPVGPGGAGVLPGLPGSQLRGDPDIKFDPVSGRFIYAAIFIRASDGLQGLSVSVSNAGPDAGSTWSLPLEVPGSFIVGAAADKEFIDVNPATGRILISWTSFTAGPPAILTSYSDDLGQTWSPAVTVGTPFTANGEVQSSVPRFLPGASNGTSVAYLIWRASNDAGLRNEGCSRSLDGGATWEPQVALDATWFSPQDQILGSDRVNTSPDLAVDHTTGRVYAVYQRNDAVGTGDIALRTFVGPCATGTAVLLNSNPGNDRAQFYANTAVDQTNGRVHVGWLDQGIATSGDLIEAVITSSSDQGASWAPPTPVIDRPFHAGYAGFLGDYNQMIALDGKLHNAVGVTGFAPRFDEGQPTKGSLYQGDSYYDVRLDSQQVVPLRATGTVFSEASCNALGNGSYDPGEALSLSATIQNYVSNPVAGAAPVTGITGTLSTTTPGVTIPVATSAYPDLAPLAAAASAAPFRIQLDPSFVPGVTIDFTLTLSSAQGATQVPIRLPTGTPGAGTTLLDENFEAVIAPALPTGWTTAVGGGANDPWITSTLLTPTKAAFHDNDGMASEWMRLFSPIVTVPAGAGQSYLALDFDIVYDLEFEPSKLVEAYDGLLVRITDQTTGQLLRSIQAEGFAESITTGAVNHMPKHLVRSSDPAYFQDVSVWSGKSNGLVHVAMKLPGEGMTGRQIQVRFEYTEDSNTSCQGSGSAGPCGVALDNIQLRHVPLTASTCPNADLSITAVDAPDPVATGGALSYTVNVANSGPSAATNVVVTDTLPAGSTFVSATGTGFSCVEAAGVVTCTTPSMNPGEATAITIQVSAPAAAGTAVSTAQVAADEFDPDASNNSASVQTTVLLPANVSATKTIAGVLVEGTALTYTVVLTNSGGDQGDNPGDEFTDVLPAGLTLVGASATSGAAIADVAGSSVAWNGAIPAAGTVTITINATIDPGTAGQILSNKGTLSFDSDVNGTNDQSALTDDPGAPGASDPTSFTVLAIQCGDGTVSPGELCDDGNPTNGDGCDDNCTPSECGNGALAPDEECDDANMTDGDGCDNNCTVTGCGNGIVTGTEECDDGNTTDDDGCDGDCTTTGCGNGIVTGTEECDDGNTTDGDGCSALCETEESGVGGGGGSTTSSSSSSSSSSSAAAGGADFSGLAAEGGGCGCRVAGHSEDKGAPPAALGLMALAAMVGLRRRRRS